LFTLLALGFTRTLAAFAFRFGRARERGMLRLAVVDEDDPKIENALPDFWWLEGRRACWRATCAAW